MAKIVAGTAVITAAEAIPGHILASRPKFGACESAVDPGSTNPPTTVVIDFEDGTRTTYAVTGTGATSVLIQLANPANPSLIGVTVQPVAGIANPGSRFTGEVCVHMSAADPAGNALGDIVFVKCPTGFYTFPYTFIQPV